MDFVQFLNVYSIMCNLNFLGSSEDVMDYHYIALATFCIIGSQLFGFIYGHTKESNDTAKINACKHVP